MPLGRSRQLLDELGQAAVIMPRQAVELVPHRDAQVEREVRQVAMMALSIAPLPLCTAHYGLSGLRGCYRPRHLHRLNGHRCAVGEATDYHG
jgi:hypothetical protein